MDRTVQHLMVFPNTADHIYPFIKDSMAFIERHIPEKAHQIGFKTRIIITELLTNSIKHTSTEPTGIQLLLSPDMLVIKKMDSGPAFGFKDMDTQWPLTDKEDQSITIYTDALNGLFAKVTGPYSLSFYDESYPDGDSNFADISEHYGLIIICRASHSFVYQHNPQSQQNIFTVSVKLT